MNAIEIEQKVIEIIKEKLDCDRELMLPDAVITDDLGADSLDVIEIVMELESQFNITIPDEVVEVPKMTIQNAIDMVKDRAAGR